LGNAAYKNKDFATAHQHYDKAIELDPANIVFYNNKAGLMKNGWINLNNLDLWNLAAFFEEAKYDECIAMCQKAAEIGREHRADYKQIAKFDCFKIIKH
jgi:stress-induced-phosphoprotein 1